MAGHLDYIQDLEDMLVREEEDNRIQRVYLRDYNNPVEKHTDDAFFKRFRFSKDTVRHVLLQLIEDEGPTMRGLPLPSIIKMCIASRFFATGNFQV